MEFELREYQLPELSFNFEALRTDVEAKAKEYDGLAYTPERIAEVKADRAELNKLRTRIDDARKEVKKTYNEPLNKFEMQIKSILAPLDAVIGKMDALIKTEQEERRKARAAEIEAAFTESLDVLAAGTAVDKFRDEINVSAACRALVSSKCYTPSSPLKAAEAEADKMAAQVVQDLKICNTMEYPGIAIEEYLRSFSLASAMEASNKISRAAAQKAALAQTRPAQTATDRHQDYSYPQMSPTPAKAPAPAQETPQWITLSFFMTPAQALGLRRYCETNSINYKMGG